MSFLSPRLAQASRIVAISQGPEIPFMRPDPGEDDEANRGSLQMPVVPCTQKEPCVIKKTEIMPLILARCPSFTPAWEKHQAFWQGEEAGIYNDLAEFATFIVDAYAHQDIESVLAGFATIEELLVGGDEEVRTAAAIGFLEDVRNSASWRPFGAAVFIQWLGPNSKEAWAEIEHIWRGKRSLADVIRAERAAAKDKPKS